MPSRVRGARGEVYPATAQRFRPDQPGNVPIPGSRSFANPRNAAAGTIRKLDPALVAKRRGLRTFVTMYQAGQVEFEGASLPSRHKPRSATLDAVCAGMGSCRSSRSCDRCAQGSSRC